MIPYETDFDCWVDKFMREQLVPELFLCEFGPRMRPLGHWSEGPRWKDKKLIFVMNILRWGWVFFKSRLQKDVRRFGRTLTGLFSQQIFEFDQAV